ncbi:MAG: hypothetical protein WAM14_08585 [Candidatus Nitrosopolaris sp.]
MVRTISVSLSEELISMIDLQRELVPREKRSMLSYTKKLLEDGFIMIDKRFNKLLTALHTCVDREGIIDKNATSHTRCIIRVPYHVVIGIIRLILEDMWLSLRDCLQRFRTAV